MFWVFRSPLATLAQLIRLRTCVCFLSCTYGSLRIQPISLHNLRIHFSVRFGSDASRFDIHGILD